MSQVGNIRSKKSQKNSKNKKLLQKKDKTVSLMVIRSLHTTEKNQ